MNDSKREGMEKETDIKAAVKVLLMMHFLKMIFKMAFPFKRFITNGALKRSRVAVNRLMFCEITLFCKCFRANRALVCFNASVK